MQIPYEVKNSFYDEKAGTAYVVVRLSRAEAENAEREQGSADSMKNELMPSFIGYNASWQIIIVENDIPDIELPCYDCLCNLWSVGCQNGGNKTEEHLSCKFAPVHRTNIRHELNCVYNQLMSDVVNGNLEIVFDDLLDEYEAPFTV